MRPEPFKVWTRPLRLRRHLGRYLPAGQNSFSHLNIVMGSDPWHVVEIRREPHGLMLFLATRDAIADDRVHFYYRAFMPVIVYLVSRAAFSVDRAVAELSDGSSVASDHIVFSANFADALLVPD